MSRAIAWAITHDSALGGQFLAVNTGSNKNDYQVKEIAKAVATLVDGTKISINKDAPLDKRSYSVDFSLFESLATDFLPIVQLDETIRRLYEGLKKMNFVDKDFRQSPFIRLNILRNHMDVGRLGRDLAGSIFENWFGLNV